MQITQNKRIPVPCVSIAALLGIRDTLDTLAASATEPWLSADDIAAAVGMSKRDRNLAKALELAGWTRRATRRDGRRPWGYLIPGVTLGRYERITSK